MPVGTIFLLKWLLANLKLRAWLPRVAPAAGQRRAGGAAACWDQGGRTGSWLCGGAALEPLWRRSTATAMWWPKERHPRLRAQRGSRGRTESSESGQGWDARRDPADGGRTCVHCPVWSGSLGPGPGAKVLAGRLLAGAGRATETSGARVGKAPGV